jgi:hypothetical protein
MKELGEHRFGGQQRKPHLQQRLRTGGMPAVVAIQVRQDRSRVD